VSIAGAARQRNIRVHLHRVWFCGREKGAAVAQTGSMVENLSGGGTFSRQAWLEVKNQAA
jgi:hypothetical protein